MCPKCTTQRHACGGCRTCHCLCEGNNCPGWLERRARRAAEAAPPPPKGPYFPKLTTAQCSARATALEEAADHLDIKWTDNPDEIAQGKIVSEALRKQAKKWWKYKVMRYQMPR